MEHAVANLIETMRYKS